MWGLCVDGDGQIVLDPNTVLRTWTLEQVMTAWDLKMMARDRVEEARRLREAQKNART